MMRRVNVMITVSATVLIDDQSTNSDCYYLAEQLIVPALRDKANYLRQDEGLIAFFVSAKLND